MKLIIAAIVLVALSMAGYVGWKKYESSNELALVQSNVRATVALMSRQDELEKSETVTFAEFFKKSESSIDDLDRGIVSLRTAPLKIQLAARDSAIEYATSAQEVIRSSVSQARYRMKATSAEKAAVEARQEAIGSTNEYTVEWAQDRARKARVEQLEALNQVIKELQSLGQKNQRVVDADRKIKLVFGQTEGMSAEMLRTLDPGKSKG